MTRRKRLTYTVALGLAAAAIAFGASATWDRTRTVSAAGLSAGDPLYYEDPMHPDYRSDRPGTAPDCGMALVPVYGDRGADRDLSRGETSVHVDPDQQRLIGARVSIARKGPARHELRLYARVVADETRVYRVNVGIDGFIRRLSSVTTGSQVVAGQWLATFSAPEARTAIQSYVVAVDAAGRARAAGDGPAQLDLADAGIRQAADRLLNFGMAPGQIEEIGRTRIVPADIQIAAPGAGLVLERNITPGERFVRGAELYRIADLRRVWIEADLFGIGSEHVQPGTAASIEVPGAVRTLPAEISRTTLPEFDPSSQSLKVRLEADNPGLALRPGMFVDVTLTLELPPAITVPIDAVIDAGIEKHVFVQRASGVFERRRVETGIRLDGSVQILHGLTDGDRVVVSGAFLFDAETRMRSSIEPAVR